MLGLFEVQIEQVTQARHCDLREAIGPIETAIQEAWATTRRQIEEADFDRRIAQTAFAQFLVHNVRNEVFRLDEAPGDVETLPDPQQAKNISPRGGEIQEFLDHRIRGEEPKGQTQTSKVQNGLYQAANELRGQPRQ